jgi:hypothetical protein
MPSVTRLSRLARIGRILTLPETRGLVMAAGRSQTLRDIAQRAVHDRAALVRDLRNPANARYLLRSAVRHPAVRELADVGVMVLPVRYLPLGLAATWATRRLLRRHLDPPTEVLDAPAFGAGRSMKNVTPPAAGGEGGPERPHPADDSDRGSPGHEG